MFCILYFEVFGRTILAGNCDSILSWSRVIDGLSCLEGKVLNSSMLCYCLIGGERICHSKLFLSQKLFESVLILGENCSSML